MQLSKKIAFLVLFLCLAATCAWRVSLAGQSTTPFNSDEAVVGLMAKHILQGEIPIFFYGQAYMGSLDALLVAAGFAIFGAQVEVIRYVQIVLYLLTIILVYLTGARAFHSRLAGLFAAILLCVPSVNVLLYTTASLGGYGESLLIGSALIYLLVRFHDLEGDAAHHNRRTALGGLIGFVCGLGAWADGLTLIFSIPVGIALLVMIWRDEKKSARIAQTLVVAAGAVLGAFPIWIFAIQNGSSALIRELLGSAVAVEQTGFLQKLLQHLLNYALLGAPALLGMRPPWEVRWLAIPLIPFVLIFWALVVAMSIQAIRKKEEGAWLHRLFFGIIGIFSAGFLFTSFGVDPSGRYFVPLAIPLALSAGDLFGRMNWKPVLKVAGLVLIVVFHFWGIMQCVGLNPPGLTTQFDVTTIIDHQYDDELITFLKSEGEMRGYTTYWVSYPLAFKSGEDLIFIPALPYHADLRYTTRDNRYPPYTTRVEESSQIAFITASNPELDVFLRNQLEELGVQWQEKSIGDYRVFFDLSEVVRPDGWFDNPAGD